MALNPDYMITPPIQEVFVDKDGQPLANGRIYFYQDNSRTTPKNVYKLSGNPGNYTYVPLPNPLSLSMAGTAVDDNDNDIVLFFYPFDDDGNQELYFFRVYDGDGVMQFTRSAWPPPTQDETTDSSTVYNYIPNGQFLAHTNLPNDGLIDNSVAETVIAQGGWTFNRPADGGSAAVDYVTFRRFDDYTNDPSTSPRYAVQVETTEVSSDAYKDIRVKFRDVNKFASETQQYTFSFSAESTVSILASVYWIKNFGSGGTGEATQFIDTVEIPTDFTAMDFVFDFGINAASSIGLLDDDYVQLAIRLPTNVTYTVQITDAALVAGDVSLVATGFPQQTNADMLTRGVAGWMSQPAYDGSDLYLPLVLTREGLTFDRSQIGNIFATVSSADLPSYKYCDGTAYVTADYDADDQIPYQRLFDVLYDGTIRSPIFGTGSNGLSVYQGDGTANTLIITTNKQESGAITLPANGTSSPAFTYFTPYATVGAGRNYKAYAQSSDTLIGICSTAGAALAVISAGTSGFTVVQLINNANQYSEFSVQVVDGASLANPGSAGKYFKFSNTTTTYYMWFHFTNETDPAPGGTGIRVEMKTTYTATDVMKIVAGVINNNQVTTVITTNSSALAGTYFSIHTASQTRLVWYKVNGVGTAPTTPADVLIEVDLPNASQTSEEVAIATQIAMNSYEYAVPNFQGQFLRDFGASNVNPDAALRYSPVLSYFGNNIGTLETYQVQSHLHGLTAYNLLKHTGGTGNTYAGGGVGTADGDGATDLTGGTETRPVNASVRYLIKY